MKLTKLMSLGIIGGVVVSAVALPANASEVTNSLGTQTETNITIVDNVDPENPDVDPLVPTDPDQTNLLLKSVPSSYNFETSLEGSTNYQLTSDLADNISVFNDRSTREWSVKAEVENGNITRTRDNKTFGVTSFAINEDLVLGTGATGIVAKSANLGTPSNTGVIVTPVTEVSITFTDTDNALQAEDELTGNINYTLYNTIDAQ